MFLLCIGLGFGVGLCIGNWLDWFTKLEGLKIFGIPILFSIIAYICIGLFGGDGLFSVAMIGAVVFVLISLIVMKFKG